MRRPARTYRGARAAAGPLLYLDSTRGVALGESVIIRAPGQPQRRGQVIEAGETTTVIQVLDDTVGLAPASSEVVLAGEATTAAVGTELLGRILDGGGHPLDGLPEPIGDARRPLWGAPLNPAARSRPTDFVETGLSAIDGLNTLVRGQKLPIFSGPGLPALELASLLVEHSRPPRGEPFSVVFVAIGAPAAEIDPFLRRLDSSGALERAVVYLNLAGDPVIERLLAPRLALTVAEYLAFERDLHVLVVLADVTHYCDALREIATAREEVPGRRGYPGTMYTDLASLFERAGIVKGCAGSLTQIPVLTMPDDDITHPIPDLTGYVTEGQVVLSRSLHRQGVFPPVDVLPSLSRLMNAGIGAERTVADHRRWADQLYALYARGREARLAAAVVGESGLSDADLRARDFGDRFETELVDQGRTRRSLHETLEIGWRLLATLPRTDLATLSDSTWSRSIAPLLRTSDAGSAP